MEMKVLVACEFSGRVRDAFAARGHDAWSCDMLPTETSGQHIQGDVLEVLNDGWDLLIAHPPCTYLTNAGVRHLHSVPSKTGKLPEIHGEKRWQLMRESADFFNRFKNAPVPQICIENPVPHRYARDLIGNYSQIIQPWMFGDGEIKKTCLWLKGLPKLWWWDGKGGMFEVTAVEGREPRVHYETPGADRWKNRSRTFPGIARAMADQWG
jgi:hypothetical protein